MKLKKNRKVLAALAIILAMIIATSATFAWVTSRNAIENRFNNDGFGEGLGVIVTETFEQDSELKIGVETPKEVQVTNTGSTPMFARVTFEEMIKLLAANGDIYTSASPSTDPSEALVTGASGYVPVPFNVDQFVAPTWVEVTNDLNTLRNGVETSSGSMAAAGLTFDAAPAAIPANVHVLKSGATYLAYCERTDGVKQSMDFSYTLKSFKKDGVEVGQQITAFDLQYRWYQAGIEKSATWHAPADASVGNGYGFFYSGDAGSKLDWANAGNTITNIGASVIPATPDQSMFDSDGIVVFNYDALATTLADNTWYYNAADGYFYYIGVLASGESSAQLLSSLMLDGGTATGAWTWHEYALTVVSEAIQATAGGAALSDAAGWNLPAGALLTKLESLA